MKAKMVRPIDILIAHTKALLPYNQGITSMPVTYICLIKHNMKKGL